MERIFPVTAVVAPLLGAVVIALFGSRIGERSARIGIAVLWISVLASLSTLILVAQDGGMRFTVATIRSGVFNYSVIIDRLAAVMLVLISLVSLVIHVYSQRYMADDPGYTRFFSLTGTLTFVLLSLVTSGNVFWLFFCWHLVTWLLVALVSFNTKSQAAREAGRRTLWIQGIGDGAFLLAVIVLYAAYGTLDLEELFARLPSASPSPLVWWGTRMEVDVASAATLFLVMSVMTKSAQFPFHIWLPGTIEAPTPVSALLHAGIVNAGGFLVNRLAPLYGAAPTTLHVLFLIGGLTALIGAATMLTQSSIKRTLVYSTMGQMGYMVMECGLGAFALAVFHLCAHGLFKATLFLNSGAQIHKARTDFKLPPTGPEETGAFSAATWATGFVVTLVLPLTILFVNHGLVQIPLLDEQGAVIFLFFGWVTSSQAVFSLYRMKAVASWKVAATMLGALSLIGFTYLWAGQAFTHFLYPAPGEAARYFQAAEWNRGLFNVFVAFSALLVIMVWVVLYGKAHGVRLLRPAWLEQVRVKAYVAFLNGLYVEDFLRAVGRQFRRPY